MRVAISCLIVIFLIALTLSTAQAEDTELDAAGLRERVVGNTMSGHYADGGDWREYYDPDGEIRGMDETRGPYIARYQITHDLICFDYPEKGEDWCASIRIDGDRLTFYKNGDQVTGIVQTKLLKGNPYNL